MPFIHSFILSVNLLIRLSVPGMETRALNKTDTFPALIEHEKNHWIRNIEKSGNNISYFYVIEKSQENMKGVRKELVCIRVSRKVSLRK